MLAYRSIINLFDKSTGKDKVIQNIGHENPREMWIQGFTYLREEVGQLAIFTPGKDPILISIGG